MTHRSTSRLRLLALVLALAPLVLLLLEALARPLAPAMSEAIHAWIAPLCHQDPGRSPWAFGHALGACYRCIGLHVGLALVVIAYRHERLLGDARAFPWLLGLGLLDWCLTQLSWTLDHPLERALAGVALGAGLGLAAGRLASRFARGIGAALRRARPLVGPSTRGLLGVGLALAFSCAALTGCGARSHVRAAGANAIPSEGRLALVSLAVRTAWHDEATNPVVMTGASRTLERAEARLASRLALVPSSAFVDAPAVVGVPSYSASGVALAHVATGSELPTYGVTREAQEAGVLEPEIAAALATAIGVEFVATIIVRWDVRMRKSAMLEATASTRLHVYDALGRLVTDAGGWGVSDRTLPVQDNGQLHAVVSFTDIDWSELVLPPDEYAMEQWLEAFDASFTRVEGNDP